MSQPSKVPARAWVVTFAGMAVNLCLGILYAWSVWKVNLVGDKGHPAGSPMTGLNEGWTYLSDAQATWAYAACGFIFALAMIPGGRIQDRFGPRVGATCGGLCLAAGCILAGLLKSYIGLLIGFGVLGGIGMGLGYAATTPAAVKWFGPHKRGLIVGLVVSGYGGAAIYIAPLAKFLILRYGLTGSFVVLGVAFSLVVVVAGFFLKPPPAGYIPPGPPGGTPITNAADRVDWRPGQMVRTWQFYALVFLFIGSSQSGLLVIANAAPILGQTAQGSIPYLAANAWLLAAYGGMVNATGRIGTGVYSDRIGRRNAYVLNGLLAVVCLLLMPAIIASQSVLLLFLAVGVAYWQYGGGLSLMPSFAADYFGPRNLGTNYGLLFIGWGIAFLIPQAAGYIKDATGSINPTFYLSAAIMLAAVGLSLLIRRPVASIGREAPGPLPSVADRT